VAKDTEVSADAVFRWAERDARVELAQAQGQMVSGGTYQNSRSAFPMCEIYLRHVREALQSCLSGVSNKHHTKGKRWFADLASIRSCLEQSIERGPECVAAYLNPDVKSASSITVGYFAKERPRLLLDLKQWKDGWKGSPAQGWNERHPIIYAVLLLALGALFGQALEQTARWIFPDNAPELIPASPDKSG
jgi:hypothetical protein